MNFLTKLLFLWKRPKVIIITGNGRKAGKEAISQVLKHYFRVGRDILIFEAEAQEINKFAFYLKKAKLSVLVITHIGDIPPDKDFFAGEKDKIRRVMELAKTLPASVRLVLNYDDETVKEIDDFTNLKTLKFGFSSKSDIFASDIKLNGGTNFKVNYRGKIVPIWLDKLFSKEQIYSVLAAVSVGTILGLNLVEISQSFKEI